MMLVVLSCGSNAIWRFVFFGSAYGQVVRRDDGATMIHRLDSMGGEEVVPGSETFGVQVHVYAAEEVHVEIAGCVGAVDFGS